MEQFNFVYLRPKASKASSQSPDMFMATAVVVDCIGGKSGVTHL
jgi:hypothetical protein